MAGYTITITPDDDEAGARTTIRVDTTSGSARITELTVRAAEGGSIHPQQIPALNLDQLIAALVPPTTTAIPAADASAAPTLPEPPASDSAAADSAVSDSAVAGSVGADAPVPDPAVPEAAGPDLAVPEQPPAPARVGRSSRAKKATRTAPAKKAPSRSRQAKADRTAAAAQSANGRRAYRRMPEPGDVLAAYQEVGGTTALARHYGVPRHTATGWLRRLRNQGMLD